MAFRVLLLHILPKRGRLRGYARNTNHHHSALDLSRVQQYQNYMSSKFGVVCIETYNKCETFGKDDLNATLVGPAGV